MTRLVHWSEGMFVRVQALQRLQHGLLERFDTLRRSQAHYPYGVVEAKLNLGALEAGKIEFEHLRVVFPNGLEVVAPDECALGALSVREELLRGKSLQGRPGEVTVWLGIPDYLPGEANVVRPESGSPQNVRYLVPVDGEQVADENTGSNSQPLPVRMLNARLMLEPKPGFECLRLLKVSRSGTSPEWRVGVVEDYVPPCLRMAASFQLVDLVKGTLGNLEEARQGWGRRLGGVSLDASTLAGNQFLQASRFLALTRYARRGKALLESPHTTPFEMFLLLHEALGELEALAPGVDWADPGTLQPIRYDHEDLYEVFRQLHDGVDQALANAEGVTHKVFEFNPDPQHPDQLTLQVPSECRGDEFEAGYLAVRTTLALKELTAAIEEPGRFELTIPSQLGRTMGGLLLRYDPRPPANWARDAYYYRIERTENPIQNQVWKRFMSDGCLGVNRRIAEPLGKFSLYVTLRSTTD